MVTVLLYIMVCKSINGFKLIFFQPMTVVKQPDTQQPEFRIDSIHSKSRRRSSPLEHVETLSTFGEGF